MSLKPEYKEELISSLQDSDLKKFSKELVKHGIIVSSEFAALDHDNLENHLMARYLVKKIYENLQEYEWDGFLNVLGLFESTVNLSIRLVKDQPSSNSTTYPGTCSNTSLVGQKRPRLYSDEFILTKTHAPILTEFLISCSHKWEELGIALHLPEYIIEECRNASNNKLKLYKIIYKWIDGHYESAMPVNLRYLQIALESPLVQMDSLAKDLYEKFSAIDHTKPLIKKAHLLESSTDIEHQNSDISIVSDGKSTLLGVQIPQSVLVSYQWMKDGQPLCDDLNYSGVHTDILFITHARQGIEGEYSCRVLFDTEEKKKKINLTVKYSHEKKHLLNKYSLLHEVEVRNTWPPIGTSTFIELALVRDECDTNKEYDYSVRGDMDDILEKKDRIEYKTVFSKYEKRALVLVEGRPGIGKTTLTRKITRDWAKGPNILNGAHLVFLVSLRILAFNEGNSLPAVLSIFYGTDCSKTVTDMLEKSDGEGACFIIDGLDEYKGRNDPKNIINKLLNKDYLPLAMVIVASRPVGTAKLRHTAKTAKRIEVLGFSKEKILNYLEEYNFKSGYEKSGLEAYLNSHINVYHMCYLPVHAAMICYIYDQHRGEIPNTETKIYELFTLLTIKRKLEHDGDTRKLSSLRKLEGDIEDCFDKVCRLAFDMTIHSKQAIPQSETETCLSDSSGFDVYSLGLVTIDSTAKLFGFEDLYSFLHLTFQEFLAAFHLTTLEEDEQLQLIRNHAGKDEMRVVWKFFCGLVQFNDLTNSKLQAIMSSKSSDDLYRFQCAFESQQKTV